MGSSGKGKAKDESDSDPSTAGEAKLILPSTQASQKADSVMRDQQSGGK